jgi:hypothetical protein
MIKPAPPPLGHLMDCENRLQRQFADLSRDWVEVKAQWFDANRARFEQERLASLGPSLARLVAVLHDFNDVALKAMRELDDPDRY